MYRFLGLDDSYSSYENSLAYVLSVPYEKTTSYMKGTEHGPRAIIEASPQLEYFDAELLTEPYIHCGGIHTAASFPTDQAHPEEFLEQLKSQVLSVLQDKKFPILLGGEHTISLAPYLACQQVYPDCSVLHIDAHTDLRDSYEGSKFSHACVMRRIREHTSSTISLGIRSVPVEDYDLIEQHRIPVFYAEQLQGNLPPHEDVLSCLTEHVYITIDLDGFDPSVIPDVGTPEPGGLQWYPVLSLLRDVFRNRNVVGCDIVELKPSTVHSYGALAAAKLAYKLIGYKFCQ